MNRKRIVKRIALLIIIVGLVFGIYQELTNYSVRRIEIDAHNRVFNNVPKTFEDTTIVFFSDIHYNNFMDKERLMPFIDTINQLNPDILLFGGDLFDHPSVEFPNENTIKELTDLLSSLNASLGKYAVLGNHDHESPTTNAIIQSILVNSGFHVLINESAKIYNQHNEYIIVVGVDSQLLGNPDLNQAFANTSKESLTILLSHTPDIIDEIDSSMADWQLSGHSHGGQISLPLIGPLYKVPYAEKYPTSQKDVNGVLLDVSNGVGTTRLDMRLFANPQIHYYTLKYE
jgi:uncharacterized protein